MAFGIMVHGILRRELEFLLPEQLSERGAYSVTYDDCVLGYELPLICEVFRVHMRGPKPKWVVTAFNFLNGIINVQSGGIGGCNGMYLDNGSDIRKVLLIVHIRQATTTNYTIEFSMGLGLNIWIRWDKRREPLHDSSRL